MGPAMSWGLLQVRPPSKEAAAQRGKRFTALSQTHIIPRRPSTSKLHSAAGAFVPRNGLGPTPVHVLPSSALRASYRWVEPVRISM